MRFLKIWMFIFFTFSFCWAANFQVENVYSWMGSRQSDQILIPSEKQLTFLDSKVMPYKLVILDQNNDYVVASIDCFKYGKYKVKFSIRTGEYHFCNGRPPINVAKIFRCQATRATFWKMKKDKIMPRLHPKAINKTEITNILNEIATKDFTISQIINLNYAPYSIGNTILADNVYCTFYFKEYINSGNNLEYLIYRVENYDSDYNP